MNEYVGIPYKNHGRDRNGVDCWGLVEMFYREQLRIELPDYSSSYQSADDTRSVSTLLSFAPRGRILGWAKTAAPVFGDVLLMRVGAYACHVGVCLGDDFLHCLRGRNSVIESMRSVAWMNSITGSYKWTGN